MTMERERDYQDFLKNGIRGNVTRGVVVDVSDPLQSGRVRVWIPLLHGGVPPTTSADDPSFNNSVANKAVSRLGDLSNQNSISCLPWAPVLGHNWAPTYDIVKGTLISSFGVFNIPKPGTEVFVIFEEDDPNFPVIIGSVFHQQELKPTVSTTPLIEITPGTSTTLSANLDYNSTVAQNYNITSQNGYSLLLSDIPGQEEINLGGSISFFTTAEVGDYSTAYKTFTNDYPNFPTTQSAPYTVRNSLTNTNISVMNVGLLQPLTPSVQPPVSSATSSAVSTNQTPSPNPTTSGTLTKALPFGKNVSFHDPGKQGSSYGSFLDKRYSPGPNPVEVSVHTGIDLDVKNTPLLAPINGRVIYTDTVGNSGGGKYILYQGMDGYCHTFMHLSSISSSVGQICTVGQQLGVTGNTGHVLGANGGFHLHWEVWNPNQNLGNGQTTMYTMTTDPRAVTAVRNASYKNPSKFDPGHYPLSTSPIIFQDALHTWLHAPVEGATVVTSVGVGQLDTLVQGLSATGGYQYNKQIGLQTSMTPGAESIYLRHSSGAYLGFDPDGNFKLYTPGSAEFRVNRNLVFDVLGGIFNSCMAMYNRAREVMKSFSGARAPEHYQVNAFNDFPTDKNAAGIAAKYHLPKIFARIDQTRKIDMLDALKQSTSNIYYTLAAGALGQAAPQIVANGYAATPDTNIINTINWSFTNYDGLINKSWSTYIQNNPNPIASHLTPRILKAMMLLASLGNAYPQSANGLTGLFQISSIAALTIKQSTDMTPYSDPATNIDLAVQFINSRLNSMFSYLGVGAIYSDNTVGGEAGAGVPTFGSKEYAMRAVLMDYIYCVYKNQTSTDIEQLYKVLVDGGMYSYPALEQSFLTSSLFSENSIYRAAVENYGANIIAITNNSQFVSP